MRIKRLIHYFDHAEGPGRYIVEFDEPVELEPSFGRDDPDIYRGVDLCAEGVNETIEHPIAPLVHENGILQVTEPVTKGEIISIDVRPHYRLKNLIYEDSHELNVLKWEHQDEGGLGYWFLIGKSGIFQVTGEMVPDSEGYFERIKSNIRDLPYRRYLTKLSQAPAYESDQIGERWPDVLDTGTAARYLDRSVSWLYKMGQRGIIRRTPDKRFRKIDLDQYLANERRRR